VDKYYTFDEYKSMNAEQKRHLHTLCQEAGGKRNASTVDSLLILKKRMTRN
jgi:hypothetical protein